MLLSGGMDKLAFLTDPATGQAVRSFRHNEWVTAVCPHPTNRDMFLAGGNSAGIVCWDARTATKVRMGAHPSVVAWRKRRHRHATDQCVCRGAPWPQVAEYQDSFGQVHDLAFLPGGKLFVSTAVATRRSNIDRGIIVWDLNTVRLCIAAGAGGCVLTCSCDAPPGRQDVEPSVHGGVQLHVTGSAPCRPPVHSPVLGGVCGHLQHTAAVQAGQDQGTTWHPALRLRGWLRSAGHTRVHGWAAHASQRFEGHTVGGYRVDCDISRDGGLVVTGSSAGSVHLYHWSSSRVSWWLSCMTVWQWSMFAMCLER